MRFSQMAELIVPTFPSLESMAPAAAFAAVAWTRFF